jgi:FtsZ-binding cell division protein ZapB
MESKENKEPELVKEPKKKVLPFLFTVIVLLSLVLAYLVYLHFAQKAKMIEMEIVLTTEKDSLANELSNLIYQYDTLKSDNDSLNVEIQVQQDRIKNLLAVKISNAQKIRLYKKELSTLREVMKSYIRQIDSLNTKNVLLTAENIEVRSQLSNAQEENVELSKIKKELTSKVEMASVLQAKNILAVPINSRGKEKYKIGKIAKIRICFTLRENPIVEAENKEVFLRIIRPDEVVLATSADNIFEAGEEQLVYSANRVVEYLNQDVDMCIYWNNDGQLIKGTYNVFLFLEGNEIGTTSFLLK